MIEILDKVNYLYPLEIGGGDTTKKDLIKVLLKEIHVGGDTDKIIDANDIETISFKEDLSIKIGIRSFILDEHAKDGKGALIDYNRSDDHCLAIARRNLE